MLRIPAVGGPAEGELRPGDTLILTAKTQDAAALLDEWAWQPVSGGTVAAETLPVVCAQNAVASERSRCAGSGTCTACRPAARHAPGAG